MTEQQKADLWNTTAHWTEAILIDGICVIVFRPESNS